MGGGNTSPSGEDPGAFDRVGSEATAQTTLNSTSQSGSASGSSGGGGADQYPPEITDTELRELESASQSFSSQPAGNGTPAPDAPTPGEFATQTFATGVQARRIEAGYDGHASSLPEDTSGTPAVAASGEGQTIGGWDAFDEADTVDKVSLSEAQEVTGRTVGNMYRAELKQDGARSATEAYITDYSGRHEMEHAHSQMASYTALDAMGVQAPRHSYNPETQQVTVEGVSKPDYNAVNCVEVADSHPEYAQQVDPDQLKDTMAANALIGNRDLSPDNMMVGEDGRVHTFDYDWTTTEGTLAGAEAQSGMMIEPTLDAINEVRDEPLGFNTIDVYNRVEELATQMDTSGMVDRVSNAASEVDEYFQDGSTPAAPDGSDIDPMGERIEKHVTNWSTENDEFKI